MFTEIFPKNSDLDNSGNCLTYRTNLKVHNISITLELVNNVITYFGSSSKAPDSDGIPVVVLKNYKANFLSMLAKLLNICVKESYYLDFGKVSSVIPVLKNIW